MSPLLISMLVGAATTAAGIGGTLWYKDQYHQCVADAAVSANKAQAAVDAALSRDAAFTLGLQEHLRPLVDAIKEQGHATQVALAKVKSDPRCDRTPAAAAYDNLVRPADSQARPDTKGPPRP